MRVHNIFAAEVGHSPSLRIRCKLGKNGEFTIPARIGESGYALLMVFLMAAMIAIALYTELPRVALESQRAKEGLLIERGEQYKRAIQLFVRKVGRYPATIEELESLNNIRYLRKRYVDPMTGQEKWRLIHISAGVLTDSVVQKKSPLGQQPQAYANTFIGQGPTVGAATNDPTQPQVNPALQRRPSDSRPVVTQEAPPPPAPASAETEPEDAATDTAANSATNDAPVPPAAPNPPPASGMYVSSSLGQSSSGGGIYVAPSLGQPPGPMANSNNVQTERMLHGDFQAPGSQRPQADPVAPPPASPAQSPTTTSSLSPTPAVNPGATGESNLQPPAGFPGMGGAQIGGGIAGVASESTGPAIKVYNDRNKYNEWEFVYDQTKDRGLGGVQNNGGVPGTPAQAIGSLPGQSPAPAGAAGQPPQPQPQQPPN